MRVMLFISFVYSKNFYNCEYSGLCKVSSKPQITGFNASCLLSYIFIARLSKPIRTWERKGRKRGVIRMMSRVPFRKFTKIS